MRDILSTAPVTLCTPLRTGISKILHGRWLKVCFEHGYGRQTNYPFFDPGVMSSGTLMWRRVTRLRLHHKHITLLATSFSAPIGSGLTATGVSLSPKPTLRLVGTSDGHRHKH